MKNGRERAVFAVHVIFALLAVVLVALNMVKAEAALAAGGDAAAERHCNSDGAISGGAASMHDVFQCWSIWAVMQGGTAAQ